MTKKSAPRYFYKGNLIKPLRTFCCAAKAENMSRAAEELHMSQPAVSQQVRTLEELFKVTLFERRGPLIKLTPEGSVLHELARPLVEGADGLQDSFQAALGRLETGSVNIAAGESTILYILPDLVRHFRVDHPGIHVHLHNVTGKGGMAMIRAEEVDFAVGSMIDVPPDILYEPIYSFKPMLIMPKGHALADLAEITLEDISPYGLILPPKRLTTWRIVDFTFQRFSVPYHVTLEVGGWEVIKRYVSLGMGISIVTGICLTDDDNLVARDMSAYFPRRSYGLVTKKGRFFTPQANRFLEQFREKSRAEPAPPADSGGPDIRLADASDVVAE